MTPKKLLVLQVREPTQAVDGDDAHVQSHIHGPLSAEEHHDCRNTFLIDSDAPY